MSRIRMTLAAAPIAVAMLLVGAGAAAADNGSFADGGSSSSIVSDSGGGSLSGWLNGNSNWTQQTATGSGASNANNTLGVNGTGNTVYSSQSNSDVRIFF
ncbi:hypothetical protein [Streptacidiphilus cavernicola]|uniref:Secreted protein n=1 Tax=Streptacidiphilus cavernicola TaxID=3342716 RepID=A0ABV6VVV1_9ACTN